QVVVPDVVADGLIVPDPLARGCIERQHGVREEVLPQPVSTVKVEGRRTRRDVDDAALFVERHAGPVVRSPDVGMRVGRPAFVPDLAMLRCGVYGPGDLAGPYVVCADVARRRGQRLADPRSLDEQVAIDDAWRVGSDVEVGDVPPQPVLEIDD